MAPSNDDLNMKEEAMRLAAAGLPVIPVHFPIFGDNGKCQRCSCRDGQYCNTPGKHPFKNGWQTIPHSLATEAASVKLNWEQNNWKANIGIPAGSKWGLVVLDVDGQEGIANHMQLQESLGQLPVTATAATGSGGLHYYFRYAGTPIPNSAGKLAPKVDVRGENGFVVAPPSLHMSGARYAWTRAPWDVGLATLPEAWASAMLAGRREADGFTQVKSSRHVTAGLEEVSFTRSTELEALQTLYQFYSHPLITWMVENPESVNREVWRGVAVNLAAAADGHPSVLESARKLFHEASRPYKRYSPYEANKVWADAVRSADNVGPTTFAYMIENGAPEGVCHGGSALVVAARKLARKAE